MSEFLDLYKRLRKERIELERREIELRKLKIDAEIEQHIRHKQAIEKK